MGNHTHSTRSFSLMVFVFLLTCDPTQASKIKICHEKSIEDGTVTLELSLSHLTEYEGNCTCSLNRVNIAGNVTMTSDIQKLSCDSVTLDVEHWNYSPECDGSSAYNETLFVKGYPYIIDILMTRGLESSSPFIDGSITFTSLDQGHVTLECKDANYDIPASTTTTMKTTTPAPSPVPTILAIAGGVLVGFIILMIILCLCIRYRQNRRKKHDANQTNMTGTIPFEDRERIDPEMTRYSWYKSLPLRLKRLYTGESRKSRPGHGRGAKGRTKSRRENGDVPTGSSTKKVFQRLFRTKSSSIRSHVTSRASSTIEDDVQSRVANEETNVDQEVNDQVFDDPGSANQESKDEAGYSNPVTVHKEAEQAPNDPSSEEELVSSLFGDYADVPDVSPTTEVPENIEVPFDDNYATVGSTGSAKLDETSSTESASTKANAIIPKTEQEVSGNSPRGGGQVDEPSPSSYSINDDIYSVVSKKGDPVQNNRAQQDEVKSEEINDVYAVVDKSMRTEKPVPNFRT